MAREAGWYWVRRPSDGWHIAKFARVDSGPVVDGIPQTDDTLELWSLSGHPWSSMDTAGWEIGERIPSPDERPAPADAAERMLPWTCSECGDRQKLRHEGGGKYSCPSCKQDFYQYDTPAWRDRFAPGKAPADAALAEAVKWANDLAGACRAYRCGVKLGTEADASRLRTLAAYATRAAQERRAAVADATDAFMDIDLDWINDEIESLSFRDAPDTNRRRIDSLIRIRTALLTNKRLYEALAKIAGMNDLSGVPDEEVMSALANALQECEITAREAMDPGFYTAQRVK